MSNLFESGKLGELDVKNRVFMAPLTRSRANRDGTPHEMTIKYYAQRASAGLIIAEGSQIGRMFISNPDLPERLRAGAELTEPDQDTFYGGDEKGYSDYSFLPVAA